MIMTVTDQPLFEVLTRRADGRETVHRVNAPDADQAAALVEATLPEPVPAPVVVSVVQVA